ncbi:Prolyl oligopeptidase family protein [Streptomyces sp. 2224.1]|uniref:alpha/beta hydrolase family protein n=1 Tax=Streptomyces sp. 2224.1 TaxID=1881020 RepID=UPI000898C52A|nr:alpha/beta fold hydrolase [Streptomyces sp. 2224.1]SEC08367.1 Prolyl oligopeptidase family protein [Streptomyces sp. 2224.1]
MSAADEEAALLGLAPVAPDRTVAYGPHPDQIVDLYLPRAAEDTWAAEGERAPVGERVADGERRTDEARAADGAPAQGAGPPLVVLLHGGFWRAAYDRRHLSPLAAALATQGLPVALAEYRRVGAGGGAPQTFDDVTAGLAAAVRELPGSGYPVLAGHSAGGQLALLAAARPGTRVSRVLAVAPVADLARAHALGLSNGAVAELLGDGPGLAERIAAADPVCHPPAGVPVTILHGTDDPDVPIDLSRRYAAHSPGTTDLRELPGVGHYGPVTPGSPSCHTLFAQLRRTCST